MFSDRWDAKSLDGDDQTASGSTPKESGAEDQDARPVDPNPGTGVRPPDR